MGEQKEARGERESTVKGRPMAKRLQNDSTRRCSRAGQ